MGALHQFPKSPERAQNTSAAKYRRKPPKPPHLHLFLVLLRKNPLVGFSLKEGFLPLIVSWIPRKVEMRGRSRRFFRFRFNLQKRKGRGAAAAGGRFRAPLVSVVRLKRTSARGSSAAVRREGLPAEVTRGGREPAAYNAPAGPGSTARRAPSIGDAGARSARNPLSHAIQLQKRRRPWFSRYGHLPPSI